MANDISTWTSIGMTTAPSGVEGAPIRDLRQEILQLRAELKECEVVADRYAVMLREGDHRIKNSLQLVASMMRLQARRESGTSARAALLAAAARVGSVAGIHDALQATRGLDAIDLGAALQKMGAALQAMAGDEGHIQVIVHAEPLEVPVALAQPLVLAVNELVVNALRHAFGDRDSGSVTVVLLRTQDGMTVSVADDGIGLPPNHASAPGYGMSLVDMMIKQIGGELRTETRSGARFTISAPLPKNA